MKTEIIAKFICFVVVGLLTLASILIYLFLGEREMDKYFEEKEE